MKELSCGSNRSTLSMLINSLGRVEKYDATQVRCCSFAKASDVVDGMNIRLTNMAGGYPFNFAGTTWHDSEMLYLCGEFSEKSPLHQDIQEQIRKQTSGFAAKRFIKNKYKDLIRKDFADFRVQWMLFVVWQKCKSNAEFARLLSQISQDVVIIENTTKQRCESKEVWGCSNIELAARRKEVEKDIIKQAKADNPKISKVTLKRLANIETCKVNGIGTFVGQNNLGKILMICRDCLINGAEPPIDYGLLESKDIHILGKRISFTH